MEDGTELLALAKDDMDPSPSNFPENKNEQLPTNLQDRESSPKLQEKSIEHSIKIDQSSENKKSCSDDVIDHSTSNLLNKTSQSCLYQHSPSSIEEDSVYISASLPERTANSQGAPSLQKLSEGLCVWDKSGTKTYIEIIKAPFEVSQSEKFKLLEDQEFCISFKEETVEHVRCHSLETDDSQVLRSHLETYEKIKATIAVLLITKLQLNPQLHIPDFCIHIPVYITSASNKQILERCSKCKFSSIDVDQDEDIESSAQSLLEYFETYVFPGRSSSVTISDHPAVFKQITKVIVDEELLKDKSVCKAVTLLCDKLDEIINDDFLFLIHLLGILLKSIDKDRLDRKTSTAIKELRDKMKNCIILLSQEQLTRIVNTFYSRGNFEVKTFDSSPCTVYHSLHNAILMLVRHIKDETKPEEMEKSNLSFYLKALIMLISVAIKFKDCEVDRCKFSPLGAWNYMSSFLSATLLTSEVVGELSCCFRDAMCLNLPPEHNFFGCGALKMMLKKSGRPRSFSDMENIVSCLNKWITVDIVWEYFCHKALIVHKQAILADDEVTRERQKQEYISTVTVEEDVVTEGFSYLESVYCCYKSVYNKNLEIGLKEWITFILKFLNIMAEGSLSTLDMIFNNQSYTFCDHCELSKHCFKKVQECGQENLQSISLKQFIELSCRYKIWNTEIVLQFFRYYERILFKSNGTISSDHVEALDHFSESFKGASNHKFLVDHLLKPLSQCYVSREEPLKFVLDLVQLQVKSLLEINDYNDLTAKEEFCIFLKEYCSKNNIGALIIICKDAFTKIQKELNSGNNFKNIVLNAIAESLCTFFVGHLNDEQSLYIFRLINNSVCEDMKKMHISSDKQSLEFYWKIIGHVCNNIWTSEESMNWIYRLEAVLVRIGIINREFRKTPGVSQLPNIPEVKAYIGVADTLRRVLHKWKVQFDNDKVSYDQLHEYFNKKLIISEVAKQFGMNDMVVLEQDVKKKQKEFCDCHKNLSTSLIRVQPNNPSNWSSLHDMLLDYRVEIPEELLRDIKNSVYFPGTKPTEVICQQLPSTSPSLHVKVTLTLKKLNDIIRKLECFLRPLLPVMTILDYFHLQKSVLFKRCMEDLLPLDKNVTTEELAHILENVKQKLESILTGTATFINIKTFPNDIRKELQILIDFVGFQKHPNVDVVISHFEYKMIIHQILQNLNSLFTFCEDFQLSQCMNSQNMIELKKLVNENRIEEKQERDIKEDLKTIISTINKIESLLCIKEVYQNPNEKFQFLNLFEPLNANIKELLQFLNENNFRGKGQVQFEQLLTFVTQRFRHEEYNAEILTTLYTVFYLIVPLYNPELSFQELIETVSQLETSTCLAQLQIVRSNIDLITMWFSIAEGDTLASTTTELCTIVDKGTFHITVSALAESNANRLVLMFQPFQKELSLSSDLASLQSSNVIIWNSTEIKDFIHRLGFANSNDDNTKIGSFMELFEIVIKMQRQMESLYEMGHPDYSESAFPHEVKCSANIFELKEVVMKLEQVMNEWSDEASINRDKIKWLSFFTNARVLKIYEVINSADLSKREKAMKILKKLCFLVPFGYSDDVMCHMEILLDSVNLVGVPTEIVGSFLDALFQFPGLQLPLPPPHPISTYHNYAVLHQCHNFSPKQLIVYLASINEQLPKSYEIFRCHSDTTESDIKLMFQRIEFFPRHYYFLEVNTLPSGLQESLIQQHIEIYGRMLKSGNCCTIHFVETSSSLLYEAPYINTIKPEAKEDAVRKLPENHYFNVIELVYGSQGNGKTHYIKSQLGQSCMIMAINEAFSTSCVLNSLNSLNDENETSIHINFTLLPPGSNVADEETKQFTQLINKIGWFMFDLFILGFLQDLHTGVSFGVSKQLKWKIYIEVPSITNNPDKNLSLFRDLLPTFYFIGSEILIDSSIPYVVDDDVQLVCKYLRALKLEEKKSEKVIDRLYKKGGNPVKFGNERDIDSSECLQLLNDYMPDVLKECKISQKLFIKYMKRRCQFLDNFPAYNYNQGKGTKGEDTTKLGSTLMKAMLKEVEEFCDPSTKENWSLKAHQQLLYEQHEGGGSIDLITLYPNNISYEEKEAFEILGFEIPTMIKLYERSTLDKYLAKALSLPLSEVTEVQEGMNKERYYKRLKIIDDNNYVLTLDYALKMINIHERRECGMPVIIEGETGVGKTELLKMLSKLWNYSWEVQWSKLKEELQTLLREITNNRKLRLQSSCQHQPEAASINNEESLIAENWSDVEVLEKAISKLKQNPILSLIQPKHMTHNFWKIVDGANIPPNEINISSIETMLRELLETDVSTFYKLDIHAGLNISEVINFFDEINKQAQRIKRYFSTSECVPRVTVYLDEINTSSCMGLFKEIVTDRTVDGKPLSDNMFIIASCNPLRDDSTAVLRNMKNVWLKPSYYVRELHPTINYLKWDYGAMNHIQELEYVTAKMRMLTEDFSDYKYQELAFFIMQSQLRIREYAEETLIEAGYSSDEAKKCAKGCVSQRDMQRVFDFYKWLLSTYKQFKRFSTIKEQQMRAVLVALGLVYYLRLGKKDRKNYSEFLNAHNFGYVDFTTVFTEELDWYIERVDLPPGIAKTTALKENVLANIVCCQTQTPLIIIGEPGTSKSLSFNIVANTFKGRASKHDDFKVIKLFKGLQPFFYQCSQHTTSKEIQNLFNQAIQRQKIYDTSSVPTYCVVYMDEAGLPEEQRESLKVLHYFLDRREVSFVAISNHALDAAKTNRAISVYRPETSSEDLKILANDFLRSTNPLARVETNMITELCTAFSSVMKVKKFRYFYGQRDFLHFISFLQRKRGTGLLNEEIVLEALERNLNGHEDFMIIHKYFLKEIGANYSKMYHKNVLEIVDQSLKDLPSSNSQTKSRPEHTVRYKLIIDTSEDDSAVRYLFACGVLNKKKTQMFACSEFVEGSHMHINTIAGIVHSVEQGHTILMFQTNEIHESFYELFNQHFRILYDPKKGLRLFANISIGAHTMPCRVHPEFQCIVVVKKSELNKTPQPFLNRFEKFLFSYNAIYSSVCETKPSNIQVIIKTTYEKVSLLVKKVGGSRSFVGYRSHQDCSLPDSHSDSHNEMSFDIPFDPNALSGKECGYKFIHETLHSLLLSLLPSLDHEYESRCEIEEKFCDGDTCLAVLVTALNALHTKAGWKIPQVSDCELKVESKIIFDMLLKDEGFSGTVKEFDFKGAVGEALDALHNRKEVQFMGEDSCLVIAMIVQWLVQHVTKHLMHLLTPEALVVNARHMPNVLIKSYFKFQEHFSLKILIKSHLEKLERNQWQSELCSKKVLVYTRQSHLFGCLPSIYPSEGVKDDSDVKSLIESTVYDDLKALKIYKISPGDLEGEIQKQVQTFVENTVHTIFLIIANMKDITVKMINHLRIIVEQKENESLNSNKLIMFLLQFPQEQQLFTLCYPVLFLSGWDHFYLDSLTTDISVPGLPKSLQNVVDIRQCFHVALGISNTDCSIRLSLEPLLEETITVTSPRMVVGTTGGVYNKPMSIIARQTLLKKLLIKDIAQQQEKPQSLCTPVGEALCSLFTQYWDNATVAKFLQDAAHFTFCHQSTLGITSYIQTRIKSLFYEFVIYMLWLINQDCNLDCYDFSDSSSNTTMVEIFGGIVKSLFFKLPSLSLLPHACHALQPPMNKGFHFPFFGLVYHNLEKILDGCQQTINKTLKSKAVDPFSSVRSKPIKEFMEKEMFKVMKEKLQELVNQRTENDPMILVLSHVVKALRDVELWQKYLADFIKYKCISDHSGSQTTVIQSQYKEDDWSRVIDAYFDFNHNVNPQDPISLLAWVHVHSEIHKMDLIQTIKQMERLQIFLQNQTLSETPMSPTKKDLGSFVIKRSFDSMNKIIFQQSGDKVKDFKQWYLTYRDIIQTESLYDCLHDVEDDHLRLLFFKTYMMYIVITCSESLTLTKDNITFAIKFFHECIEISDNINMVEVLSRCILLLKDQSRTFFCSVINKILTFIFHTVNLSSGLLLCEWFFQAALPDSPNSIPLLDYLSPAEYKYHLLRILTKDDNKEVDPDNVLDLFQPTLRMEIGKMMPKDINPLQCVEVFMSDESKSNNEMCVLANMYLLAAYEQICRNTVSMSLFVAISKLERFFEKVESSTDNVKRILLILEREAFMQRCLQILAENLAKDIGSQETILHNLPERIDALLQQEGLEDKRGFFLSMHLWKELKNIKKFIRIMTEHTPITCLSIYSDQLRERPDYKYLQFSFLSFFEGSEVGLLYSEVCTLLKKIHVNEREGRKLKTMANSCKEKVIAVDFSTGKVFNMQKIHAFRMCIWLCVYNEFYQKDIKSESLARVVSKRFQGYFSDEFIRLIACFLNKDLVQKHLELEGIDSIHIKSVNYEEKQVNPVFNFFFASHPDAHEKQIRNALPSVIAVALACPDQTTHLWYHLFSPDKLIGTYISGFLLDSEIKEGILCDCGVMLNEQGEYGRPEYLQRAEKGILNLHSLYLLLWCNFGAFCVNLLTQPGSNFKGTVISDYQPAHHYCKSQMNAMWLHMSTNLELTDEQLSLLIVRSMQRVIQISCENPKSGLLSTSEQRDDYEQMWHQLVFVPSLDEVKNKFGQYFPIFQTNTFLVKIRRLTDVYPFLPTLQEFTRYVHENCSSNELLVRFMNRYPRLQAGSAILPSLIEFYQWIHTELSYVITKRQANEITVYEAVDLATEMYSSELENHYIKLFEKVIEGCNNYLKTIGYSISVKNYDVWKKIDFPFITRETPLFYLISEDATNEQRDIIFFLVIEDIVNFHNNFLDEMKSLVAESHLALQKYICDSPCIHPIGVNEYTCIVTEHSRSLLQLVCKHQTKEGYNLDKIQEDIVVNYIAGKFKIDDCQTKLKKTFYYIENEPIKLEHPTQSMLRLKRADIDSDFKISLSKDDDFLVALEHELLSIGYDEIVEVARGLKAIIEHIKQRLDQEQLHKNNIINDTVREALPKLLYDQHEIDLDDSLKIFDDFGMSKLQNSHRACVGAIPMKKIVTTLALIVEWIEDGVYDFYTLPKAMKRPLREEDKQEILALPQTYDQTYPDELLHKLKVTVEVLINCQQHFVSNIDKINEEDIFHYMKGLSLIRDEQEIEIKQVLPQQICILKNYMALRICLRKLINTLEEKTTKEEEESKWFEYVEDLWISENKFKHLRDVSRPLTLEEVYNPTTGLQYGFEAADQSITSIEKKSIEKKEPTVLASSRSDDQLSQIAGTLTQDDVADYLRYLKLDQYVETFLKNEIDGNIMFDITSEILEELGVDINVHRIKIKGSFKQWLRKMT